MKKRIVYFARALVCLAFLRRGSFPVCLLLAAILTLALPALGFVHNAGALNKTDGNAGSENNMKNGGGSVKTLKIKDGGAKKKTAAPEKKSKKKPENTEKEKKAKGPDKKNDKKLAVKSSFAKTPNAGPLKLDGVVTATDEIVINSKKYKLGGISLEKKTNRAQNSKIEEIKKLAADLKKDFEKQKKASPRKKNKYSLDMPSSYHQVDIKLANEILRRVNLSSLSMFRTLYLPHLKKARGVKNKSHEQAHKGSTEHERQLDDRTKMALLIVGNFINEAIEKYDSGNLSKSHKEFGKWINDGANLLAYGTIYPAAVETPNAKTKSRKGVISFATAKKLLRAIIEVESSSVHMSHGRVNISLNMRTYPRDGSYVIGFMQESVDDFARGVNLFDPEINIKHTCKKLHKYLVKYNGNYDKALRHYNAGQGNMDCEQAHRYSAKVHRFMNKF